MKNNGEETNVESNVLFFSILRFVNRMISSLIRNRTLTNLKENFIWKIISSNDEFDRIDEETMIVGIVKDRKQTKDILRRLEELYPWNNSLKHIRRLNQLDDQLEILLYPKDFLDSKEKLEFEQNYFHSDRFFTTKIPSKPFRFQFEYLNYLKTSRWKNISFRLNRTNEILIENKSFDQQHFQILQIFKVKKRRLFFASEANETKEIDLNCSLLFEELEDEHGSSSRFALIRNDSNGEIYSIGKDHREENPLEHSTMIAIDLLSSKRFYQRENLRPKQFETNEKSVHLLNGLSIYLTDEPCLMCSMSLLHSRISSVFFIKKNLHFGSLTSNYHLHRLKQTNHRFHVYQLEQIDPSN